MVSPELDAAYQAAELPNGWTIVLANEPRFALQPELLSGNHAMLLCMVGDAAAVYMSAYFVRGEPVWQVAYNGFDGAKDVEESGHLPPEFDAMRTKAFKEGGPGSLQVAEIPIELARTVCGFRHDVARYAWGSPRFTVAEPA